jgi:hypothetical protein
MEPVCDGPAEGLNVVIVDAGISFVKPAQPDAIRLRTLKRVILMSPGTCIPNRKTLSLKHRRP